MSELELLAKSGFLSIVGLNKIPHGEAKKVFALPQQPTNNLMFYYVHSLMAVTQVLLNLGKKDLVIENVASENLLYLCQGVLSLRETGLWNNEQGSNWLDGGAPFYTVYKAKDGVFYSVGCIEPKFYDNFMQLVRDMGGLTETQFTELSQNQIN
jgi:crotonobetainyl-CoA:carnitine CoA-transferase CaiB-like acyl-CoA transferase